MCIEKITTELFCPKCKEETIHEITYFEDKISKMMCLECGKEYCLLDSEDIYFKYLKKLHNRIKTKPNRIKKEIKEDMSKSISSLPIRMIKKPFRMLEEYRKLKKTRT